MGLLNVVNEEFLKKYVVPCDHIKVNLEEAAANSYSIILPGATIPIEYELMVYAGNFNNSHYFIDYRGYKEEKFFIVWKVDQAKLKYSENGILTFNAKQAESWVVEQIHTQYQGMSFLIDYAIKNISKEIPNQPNLFNGLLDRPQAKKIDVI